MLPLQKEEEKHAFQSPVFIAIVLKKMSNDKILKSIPKLL